jgi:hypothetical protein
VGSGHQNGYAILAAFPLTPSLFDWNPLRGFFTNKKKGIKGGMLVILVFLGHTSELEDSPLLAMDVGATQE